MPPPVIAPDAALPKRDALLDESLVARRLPALLGVPAAMPVERVERLRTKYRLGVSLRVLHRVSVGASTHLVSTRMATAERIPRLAAAAGAGSGEVAGLRAVVHDTELDSVSWVFPCDRKLAGLGELVGDASPLAGLGVDAVVTDVAAYTPEKSVTLRCADKAGRITAFTKVYADDDRWASAIERYRRLAGPAAAVGLDLPGVMGSLPSCHVMVLEARRGRRLDQVGAADLLVGLSALGRALARLHRLPADGEHVFGRFLPDALRDTATTLARARPDVGDAAHALADRLWDRSPFAGSALLHGDVHLKNALLDGERVHVLDLDQCGRGHPMADVGSFVAAVRHRRVVGGLGRAEHENLVAAFLTAYSEEADIDSDALCWHTAAALLVERAGRAVNRVLPESLARLPALLHEAEAVLTGGRSPIPRGVRTAS